VNTQRLRSSVLLSAAACLLFASAANGADPERGKVVHICAVVGDRDGMLTSALVRQGSATFFVQTDTLEQMQAVSKAMDAAGLLGTRVFVGTGPLSRIGLAENVADAIVAATAPDLQQDEAFRVLRPGGKLMLANTEVSKPYQSGDDWTHHYHDPSNNTQSLDRLARAPFLTRFIAEPRYGSAPQSAVACSGRLFMAFGHVAWHQREEDTLDALIAVDGYNGAQLWKRTLPPGLMVDRCIMVATQTELYLAEGKSLRILDTLTGAERGQIPAPADVQGGAFWKWIAMEGEAIFGLVGQDEPGDDVAKWRMEGHGWPWDKISKGYNNVQQQWGMGRTLLAFNLADKRVLWQHTEDQLIDSRALAMKDGRIYISSFGKYVACVDARTGKDIWRRTAEKDAAVFESIGTYRTGQGWVEGWKTANYLKCTDKALYFAGPQVPWLSALSSEDGRVLWKYPTKDLQIVIRNDALYAIGSQNKTFDTRKLNPLTGEVLAEYPMRRRACTRATGNADGIFFRAHEGTGRLDVESGKTQWISPMRPSCQVGVIIASGLCYWLPWTCDCDLQMFGTIALGPAGPFDFTKKATTDERLERVGQAVQPAIEQPGQAAPLDWPAYRSDNARSAKTPASLSETAKLLWQAEQKLLTPTAPVAAGGLIFLAGADGVVRALDDATGKARWSAYTGGQVRYPPAISNCRAYVGSDDGWMYTFEAATGKLLWRFRAAPIERRIPVYGKLISTWPVASGVLVDCRKSQDSPTAFFAAGINDLDGTHVYAVNALTGELKWENNTCGHLDEFSKRGVACQGELLLHDGKLYLAGGNSVSPGVFDPATGKCLNDPPGGMGTSAPRGRELIITSAGTVKACGQPLHSKPENPVYDGSCKWDMPAISAANGRVAFERQKDERGVHWSLVAQKPDSTELWKQPLPSEPVRWGIALDAQGRIIVTLYSGEVLCFGK
jgi:outer membrane protein assembly factor BamB